MYGAMLAAHLISAAQPLQAASDATPHSVESNGVVDVSVDDWYASHPGRTCLLLVTLDVGDTLTKPVWFPTTPEYTVWLGAVVAHAAAWSAVWLGAVSPEEHVVASLAERVRLHEATLVPRIVAMLERTHVQNQALTQAVLRPAAQRLRALEGVARVQNPAPQAATSQLLVWAREAAIVRVAATSNVQRVETYEAATSESFDLRAPGDADDTSDFYKIDAGVTQWLAAHPEHMCPVVVELSPARTLFPYYWQPNTPEARSEEIARGELARVVGKQEASELSDAIAGHAAERTARRYATIAAAQNRLAGTAAAAYRNSMVDRAITTLTETLASVDGVELGPRSDSDAGMLAHPMYLTLAAACELSSLPMVLRVHSNLDDPRARSGGSARQPATASPNALSWQLPARHLRKIRGQVQAWAAAPGLGVVTVTVRFDPGQELPHGNVSPVVVQTREERVEYERLTELMRRMDAALEEHGGPMDIEEYRRLRLASYAVGPSANGRRIAAKRAARAQSAEILRPVVLRIIAQPQGIPGVLGFCDCVPSSPVLSVRVEARSVAAIASIDRVTLVKTDSSEGMPQ